MNEPPTFLSLFAGIGGFDLALERARFRCVGQVEIDPFCTRILAARFPDVPRWGDIRKLQLAEWGRCMAGSNEGIYSSTSGITDTSRVDLLVGGFPCQDFSVAGKRAGLVGYRGTLFWEIVRIAKEIHPPWGLFENVPGLLSSHRGRDFWAILQGLRECWPAVGWRILDSRYFGVPQRRRRVFFVCGPSEASVASVLFESESGGGHPAAGGEALPHLTARTGKGPDSDCTDGQIVTALRHLGSGGPDDNEAQGGHLVVGPLRSNGRGTPLVIGFSGDRDGQDAAEGISPPLVHRGDDPSAHRAYGKAAIAQMMMVRRLTPMECERLQAFPDGWTCLCQPLEAYAADPEKAAWNCQCPDGPRYRALGNAVTVSVVEWIGRRLMEAHLGLP